ncbi:hypothetical protein AB0M19_27875 [Streptomyces sp. NPDC051920]|uniref:hypothetical protein n=1 Tax=Streptomyces sp. NPDC051920 TaxID=3155523 RepID=UPI003428C8EC
MNRPAGALFVRRNSTKRSALAGPRLREQSGLRRLPEQRAHLVEGQVGGLGEHVEPEPCSQQGGEIQQPRRPGRQFGRMGTDGVPDPH